MRYKVIVVFICTIVFAMTGCGGSDNEFGSTLTEQSTKKTMETSAMGSSQVFEEQETMEVIDSFLLVNAGLDTGVEIFLEDCVCEYDKNGAKVYCYYVNDLNIDEKGYAIYIQTQNDTSTIFPVKDYIIDSDEQRIYMLWGIDSFERIQGIDLLAGIASYKILGVSSVESLFADVYGLELDYDGNNFLDLQVEFTGIREGQTKILCGNATAIYRKSGTSYTIKWEIDTETYTEIGI